MFGKKKQPEPVQPPVCVHKWRDFPWYMNTEYDNYYKRLTVEIFEPYVCIYCKVRKNVLLYKLTKYVKNKEQADEITAVLYSEYKTQLKPKPIVEDMVSDMQLVDRQWLEFADMLAKSHGPVLNIGGNHESL